MTFIMAYIVSVGIANAAVRSEKSITRTGINNTVSRSSATPRQTIARTTTTATSRATSARATTGDTNTVPTRSTRTTNTSRTATATRTANRNTTSEHKNISRPARTATTATTLQSDTFGTGYNACRNAYFTCMDQFCATQNDSYRRCVCSSRLEQIKSRENLLSDTANQLQDFKTFNLEAINKSAAEVHAMINASSSEALASSANDTSDSAIQLKKISSILSQAKSQALSTAGTLDIGGDIKQIWQTTDLADGANIANLTGEPLYNAVHAQCSQMVFDTCASQSTLNMVVAAYGMYIENDCTILSNSLNSKTTAAKKDVRQTEHEMHTARLENYDAHNSASINDCIANVRKDMTANTACGPDYVHCLDITGQYLSRDTGAPIYTTNFYQLDHQISLSGNILTNQTNRLIVAELNRMRSFATHSLDKCRDIADEVWDEFVRQAITEIYQGQQERIRTVKNECLDVVNACYDEKNKTLKDFSNLKEQLLLGQRLELSEALCREKLETCSNLYGGGTDGLAALVNTLKDITDAKIAKACRVTLQDYARDICAVPSSDTLHSYPYACRVYNPGTQEYAQKPICNYQLRNDNTSSTTTDQSTQNNVYACNRKYISCNAGYRLDNNNNCIPITATDVTKDCGDYPGSLYQRLVRYALQTCVRPSTADTNIISTDVLADVNAVMDSIRVDMGKSLATECELLGGTWVDTAWEESKDKENFHAKTDDYIYKKFYDETGANTDWGYCALTGPEVMCKNLGGEWVPKSVDTWEDNNTAKGCCATSCYTGDPKQNIKDGCDDSTGRALLAEFYAQTLSTTTDGYCSDPRLGVK